MYTAMPVFKILEFCCFSTDSTRHNQYDRTTKYRHLNSTKNLLKSSGILISMSQTGKCGCGLERIINQYFSHAILQVLSFCKIQGLTPLMPGSHFKAIHTLTNLQLRQTKSQQLNPERNIIQWPLLKQSPRKLFQISNYIHRMLTEILKKFE